MELDDETAMDGEILDDEDNPESIKRNEFEVKARAVLAQTSGKPDVKALLDSKIYQATGVKPSQPAHSGGCTQDEMLCIVCQDRRKEIVIQSCRHFVFCLRCENDYSARNPTRKECPICRKEYKKTLQVVFT